MKITRITAFVALAGGITFFALLSLTIGPMDMPFVKVCNILLERLLPAGVVTNGAVGSEGVVIWDIRLARTTLALLAGGGLAMAGAAMQGVFRNPLADPGIIGVSGGGAIGAVTAIVLGSRILPGDFTARYAAWITPVAAMAGAISMTVLIYHLSLRRRHVDLVSMLLVGIAINALGGAFIGLVSAFVATAEELQTVTFWTLGSLGRATWDLILPAALFLAPPLLLLPRYARPLNALALGEEDAALLGVDVPRVKRALIALAAALVGTTVALCGMIGFIPLVAPHIVRAAAGGDHRFLLPASALVGAALLLAADMAARTVVAPAELPLGIVTSLFGAPVFLSLIWKRNRALERA
ncbi:MAG: iron ABC transporter permease [Puniceicoccales bacterium]|jgi:iron complex transport system permease protein|nr:iron ABC transporter permease [Puniceicoccales bacterium]